MRRILTFTILLIYSINFGQTATLKVQKVYPNVKEKGNYIKFVINEHSFGEKDTIINIKINKVGFDNCYAIINNDTLKFKTKFKENETYEIEQGCCCAAFTLEAQNNPKRGIVKFKNRTNRNLGLIVAESNEEKVKVGKTQNIYASESAMCFYKPCNILLTETEYLSEIYDYNSDDRDYEKLWKEQKKYIIASTRFHFLHGEKIEIFYNSKNESLEMKQNGYLSESEYKKIME
jgi:hypothetical protein